jgi:hypothetical protein
MSGAQAADIRMLPIKMVDLVELAWTLDSLWKSRSAHVRSVSANLPKKRSGDVFLKVAILMALIFSPVCGGCPTTAKCPQDGGQADYDDSFEENGRIYCVYVHHVQTPRGPQDHRFRIACK